MNAGTLEARLGVDVGGTFTDAVLAVGEAVYTSKVPTTPADQSVGVMRSIEQVLERAGMTTDDVTHFAHGMTVTTNALLEQRGARTALLTTAGFEDVIEIGRQARPSLYRLDVRAPTPLIGETLRIGVRERTGPDGPIEPLDLAALDRAIDRIEAEQVDSVAICLMHSYAHPQHELAIEHALAERLPGVHVSRSSDLLPIFREYERVSTTAIDAYLSPLLRAYLGHLGTAAGEAGLPIPEIMQSSGGLMPVAEATRHAAWTVLSGPAGGAIAAAYLAEVSGHRRAMSFDMGGTSCDVALFDDGRVSQAPRRTVGSRVLQLPMVDVHTVGAGGGSIGWADAGGALRVGPQSAGADPGPACYGYGGVDATVTDANLWLGYFGSDSKLAGDMPLDPAAAHDAIARLAAQLGINEQQTAAGILRVADQEMARALRVVTVERGVDPRDRALVAFGGAGPMHAARLADELELERVLCPQASGVLSALGLAVSDRRRDFARSALMSGRRLTAEAIAGAVEALEQDALQAMPKAKLEVSFDLRYLGQAFELNVPGDRRPAPAELREAFDRVHEQRYGYADSDAELELVNVRLAAIDARPRPALTATPGAQAKRNTRQAMFDGAWVETQVVSGEPSPDEQVAGPAIFEQEQATVVVPPGWTASTDEQATIVLERS